MTLSLRQLEKRFGRYPALRGVSLDIRDGELLAILGPSGSGKTTLLRTIAGLDAPDSGSVLFDDDDVTTVEAARRRVGFVFQQYALFRHMTVAANIAFGLEVRQGRDRPGRSAIDARVAELLQLVELPDIGGRYPSELSGGQRQRVALARALAVSPRVLLLDEPFGALDATVRKTLRRELRRIHDATGVTTLLVTHDQEEALELADRVAVLHQGRIEQVGRPSEVLEDPASPFVAGFVGEANRFEGRVADGRFRSGDLELPAPGAANGAAVAFVRPHEFSLAPSGTGLVVERVVVTGPLGRLEGRLADGRPVEIDLARGEALALAEGQTVGLSAARARVFGLEA